MHIATRCAARFFSLSGYIALVSSVHARPFELLLASRLSALCLERGSEAYLHCHLISIHSTLSETHFCVLIIYTEIWLTVLGVFFAAKIHSRKSYILAASLYSHQAGDDMGRSDQENLGVKYFMGLRQDMASYGAEGPREHEPYGAQPASKQMCVQSKLLQPATAYKNADSHVSGHHYVEELATMAVVKANISNAVQRPPAGSNSPWLYSGNGLPHFGSTSAFAAMVGQADIRNGRQQFAPSNSSREQRGSMEKMINVDAFQIMHARGNGSTVAPKSYFPQPHGRILDPSTAGSRGRVFPFVTPALQEQASTVQAPIASHQVAKALPNSLSCGRGSASARILQPADSSIKPKISNTQLTIFYAGTVHVYNDVSSIKAQEIMLMAACGGSLSSNMEMVSRLTSLQIVTPPSMLQSLKNADAIDPFPCQPDQVAKDQISIGPSLPTTIAAHGAVPQAEDRSCHPATQTMYIEVDEPPCPQALPQARKASLARFLERRRERMLTKSPYPVEKSFL